MNPSSQQSANQNATVDGRDALSDQHNDPQQFTTMEADAAELRESLLRVHEYHAFDAQVQGSKEHEHEDLDKVCRKCSQKPPFVGSLKGGGPVFASGCAHISCEDCNWPLKELIDLECTHDPCSDVLGARTICYYQPGYINKCENPDFWNGRQVSGWPSDYIGTICLEERLCHDGDLVGLAELRESLADGDTKRRRAQMNEFRKGLFDVEGYSQESEYRLFAQKMVSAQAKHDPSASKTATKDPAQQSLFSRVTNSSIIVIGFTALITYAVVTIGCHGMLWASNTG